MRHGSGISPHFCVISLKLHSMQSTTFSTFWLRVFVADLSVRHRFVSRCEICWVCKERVNTD